MATDQWFLKQWEQWPVRVDPENTTNISFLYGGILGYREVYGIDPPISGDLQVHVDFFDANSNTKQ